MTGLGANVTLSSSSKEKFVLLGKALQREGFLGCDLGSSCNRWPQSGEGILGSGNSEPEFQSYDPDCMFGQWLGSSWLDF